LEEAELGTVQPAMQAQGTQTSAAFVIDISSDAFGYKLPKKFDLAPGHEDLADSFPKEYQRDHKSPLSGSGSISARVLALVHQLIYAPNG